MDPWKLVNDLNGHGLYDVLRVHPKVELPDLKKAYRSLAKRYHPDRGGTAADFARIQQAFEVLSDPRQREVYDTWAKQLQFRYVRGVAAQTTGGEDALLDEYEELGLHCDPKTQLVVTCEVCRRPATKECWTCRMKICEFCTLKRHWKGTFPLHWPLVNSDHMRIKLAKRELEKKRIEDGQRLRLEDPNFRTEAQLQTIRSFRDAAYRMSQNKARLQKGASISLTAGDPLQGDILFGACPVLHVGADAAIYLCSSTHSNRIGRSLRCAGYADKELHLECNQSSLLLQPFNSPPVIDRLFGYPIDCQQPIETFKTQNKTLLVICICKSKFGEKWLHLFRGDPDGARCMQPLYSLTESADDVLLEMQVPFWIDLDDVHVDIGEQQLQVCVRNTLCFCRTYWSSSDSNSKQNAVDIEESMWTLDQDIDGSNEASHSLIISLARPPVTADELSWKQGKRQDNTSHQRAGNMHLKGYRFFADDEDHHGLEDILQANMLLKTGSAYVPAKPWQHGVGSKIVHSASMLSKDAQNHLAQMSAVALEE